jgi:hypothetical protein
MKVNVTWTRRKTSTNLRLQERTALSYVAQIIKGRENQFLWANNYMVAGLFMDLLGELSIAKQWRD